MTHEAQRIAIAEACGWRHHDYECEDGVEGWFPPSGGKSVWIDGLPDYLHDLNAMHEAVKILTSPQRDCFLQCLMAATGYHDRKTWTDANFDLNNAAAAQRAEAFLRTLNLRRDDPAQGGGQDGPGAVGAGDGLPGNTRPVSAATVEASEP